MARTLKPRRTLDAIALALLAGALALPAAAQTLGDLEVRSAPGEPLDATVALGTANGAPVSAECLFLSRGAADEGQFITRAQVAVFEEGGERFARLRSEQAVQDRNAKLRIVVRCPGQPHVAYREYRDLFEPRVASTPSAPVPPLAAAPLADATGLQVRNGDSMASLAATLLPRNPAAQRAYVQAMREANPSIAGLGPTDPIPLDATVVLPDLRTLPRVKPEPRTAVAEAPASTPQRPPRAAPPKPAKPRVTEPASGEPAPAPKVATSPPPAPPKAAAKAPAPPVSAAPRRPTEGGDRMVLRLSSPEVDLSRSRNIDDASRAKLRERLLVLDNDDQVAALLSLRDSLKRLEGRVAELQLKLSAMPANLPPPPKAEAPAAKVEPPKPAPQPAPPKVEALPPKAEVAAPKVEPPAPKVEAPPPPPPKVEAAPPKVEPVPPKVEPAPPKAEPAPPKVEAVAPKVEPAPRPAPKPATAAKPARPADPAEDGVAWWIWAALAAAALALCAFAWWWLRREPSEEDLPEIQPADSMPPPPTEPPSEAAAEEREFDVAEPHAIAAARREIDSDATLATEVRGSDPATLRQRYMEERFPEIASHAIVLSDPDSVVKAARLLYEDGAIPRAVELLQFATEEHPREQRTWLALFEIYRLERMTEPFAELAQRFRDLHGKDVNWRKVQFFGREIDPGNALYRDVTVGIETIKFEAGKPPAPSTYDPIAENWLNAPMDFENELLAVDLRRALMDEANVTDEDLAPNPMPALRSVDMFTVA